MWNVFIAEEVVLTLLTKTPMKDLKIIDQELHELKEIIVETIDKNLGIETGDMNKVADQILFIIKEEIQQVREEVLRDVIEEIEKMSIDVYNEADDDKFPDDLVEEKDPLVYERGYNSAICQVSKKIKQNALKLGINL